MKNHFIRAALLSAALLTQGLAEETRPKPAPSAPTPATKATEAHKNIQTPEFEKLRKEPNTVVLDVRTKAEFDKGHIPGAVNLDVRSEDFIKEASKLDKSKTYLVHCASGFRSLRACSKLSELKFEKLYNLEGGYNDWIEKAKP